MKKTFKELREVDQMMGNLYKANPKLEGSRFGYAYKRFIEKNYIPHLKEYNMEINDARIDNAMENAATKEILKDPTDNRGFKYTKEGLKGVIKQENIITELWDEKEIEIKPHFCTKESVPELTVEQTEMLKGLIIE